ncbi:MAG: EAL domain-containing protein [Telluria sp.]|nr:EAL domain-containing protein [Telluria sp.]
MTHLMGSSGEAARLQFRLHLSSALSFVATLVIGAAFGVLSWQTVALYEQKSAERIAAEQGALLKHRLLRSLASTYALAALVRQGGGSVPEFESVGLHMLALDGGLNNLQLAPDGVVRQVVPRQGNLALLGADLFKTPGRAAAARRAIDSGALTLSVPTEGGADAAVLGLLPVYLPGPSGAARLWGLAAGQVRLADLLAHSKLAQLRAAGYDYRLSAGQDVLAGSGGALTDPVVHPIGMPNGTWLLSIAPARGWVNPYLSVGAVLLLLLTATAVASFTYVVLRQPVRLRRDAALRSAELARTNHDLKLEIIQRERAQGIAAQLNRLYSVLSHTNGMIIRVTDRRELFREVCDIAVEHGGFPLATIALCESGSSEWGWVSRASAQVQVPPCEVAAMCTRADGLAPAPVAAAPGPHIVAAGFASHVMFPLQSGSRVLGTFCLYAYEPHFFDAAQLRLLEEMTGDVSFALANIEHEELRRQGDEKLRKLSRAVEQSANAVVITDREGVIEYVNPWFTRITGYSAEEVIGQTPRILKSGETHPETHKRLWDTLVSGKEWHGELHNAKKDGELYWCLEAISPLKNEAGEVTHFVAITEDISARKQTEQTIRHLAFHDVLTGLPNRRLFRDRLNQAVTTGQRNKTGFALMLLDLDYFKAVNDTLGHDAGDALLTIVATRLGERIRSVDTLARMGGDEFALLACDTSRPEDVAALAAALQNALRAPITIQDRELYLSASIGITLYPDDSDDVDSLIKNADIALYRAKDLGRDNYQFFTDDMNSAIVERVNLANSLRRATERGEFILHYQPQVELASGEIGGVEALIRWRHPELGMVSPTQFIPLAEETGIIVSIGEWVLRTACRQARDWELAGMPVRVAVNLSARQFRQGDLAEKIGAILRETDLSPRLIEVELTEGILMADTEQTSATLDTLHRMGVQISIDDFGTGYSSLSYLKRLPIDILKIDQSFVRDIHTDPDDRSIVTAVIALAHSMHMKVVAEGVETAEQLAFLREQECDTIQGYLFSRPVPPEGILSLLRSRTRLTS